MVAVVGEPIGSLPTPTRAGYAFDGWWTSPGDGLGIRVYENDDDSIVNSQYEMLYAHWVGILSSIKIYGDKDLTSGETFVYDCFATYEDNSTEKVYPTWSATDGNIEQNGLFVAP